MMGCCLQLSLKFSAAYDDRAAAALYGWHCFEGKGAAIMVGVLASAAHAAFGLMGHGCYLFINVIQCVLTRLPDLWPKRGC